MQLAAEEAAAEAAAAAEVCGAGSRLSVALCRACGACAAINNQQPINVAESK